MTGGLARDLLIGAVPPVAIADWRYLAAAAAAGLCLFAVTGTQKALAHGLDPAMAAILGMITCIGGGVARDLLTLQVPSVLRSELYAVAALGGAGSVALGYWLGLPSLPVAAFGAALCLFLRLTAIFRGWRLPVAGGLYQSHHKTDDNSSP